MNVQWFKANVKIKANYSKMLLILILLIIAGPFEVITISVMYNYYLFTTQ